MNDWDQYHAQQAFYNLIYIVFRPKAFLFIRFIGLLLQLPLKYKDDKLSQH